jgi:hypothetical protein
MSALTDAERALEVAQAAYSTAQGAANEAQAHADELRRRVASGDGADVSPTQLAEADHASDHATLVATGAYQGMDKLTEVVNAARADEEVDRIVSTLPQLGSEVVAALDNMKEALATFKTAAQNYDGFVDHAKARLATAGQASPRVRNQQAGVTRVDQFTLAKCHASRHLARTVLSS